jgi:hypothetical protein
MKLRTKVATAAALLFGVSFALPADGDMSGIACLNACWGVFIEFGKNHDIGLGGWSYYSGFVLANVLFVALFAALLASSALMRLRFWIATLAMLQVLSWLVVNLFDHGDRFDLGIGYFVWLLSFILLFAAHCVQSPAPGAQYAAQEPRIP